MNQASPYQVPATVWQSIETEVQRLTVMIESNQELTPADVQEVKRLVTQVETTQKAYNKAVQDAAASYKRKVVEKLREIGYDKIDAYITLKKQEQKKEISDRLNQKIETYNNIIDEIVQDTTYVKNLAISKNLASIMLPLFPNVNSGAKNKAINDWTPIRTVITKIINDVDKQLNQLVLMLPNGSKTMGLLMTYFQTGDITLLSSLPQQLELDRRYIEDTLLSNKLQTEDDVLATIREIQLGSAENSDKLNQIERVISVWRTKHPKFL